MKNLKKTRLRHYFPTLNSVDVDTDLNILYYYRDPFLDYYPLESCKYIEDMLCKVGLELVKSLVWSRYVDNNQN